MKKLFYALIIAGIIYMAYGACSIKNDFTDQVNKRDIAIETALENLN